ncbi:hypothetical protein ACFL4P_02225 [Gemmatimonadota bacterium]
MDDKIKLIVIAGGGSLVIFALFFGVFYMTSSGGAGSAADPAAQAQQAGLQASSASSSSEGQGGSRSRGSGVEAMMLYSSEMEQTIPANPKIEGYLWAVWGMTVDTVLLELRRELGDRIQEGYSALESYSPPDSAFTNVVMLNPDKTRLKVEYRFFKNSLFHVEVYYSSYFKEKVFNTFLFDMMCLFGKPYEISPTVNELGNVILHVKWDTEKSLIELVSKPNGYYSLYLQSQQVVYRLEEARKSAERITY